MRSTEHPSFASIAFLVFVLLCSAHIDLHADEGKVDSLLALIEEEDVDSIKFQYYRQIVIEVNQVDRAATFPYLKELRSLAEKMENESLIADAHSLTASNYMFIGQSDSAEVFLNRSYEIYGSKSTEKYLNRKNEVINNLALLYQRTNNYERAIEMYHETIELSKVIDDTIGELFGNVNLMSLYMDLDDNESALIYFNDAKALFDKPVSDGVKKEMSNYYSAIYLNGGQLFKDLEQLDSAEFYLDIAVEKLDLIQSEYAQKYYGGYVNHSMGEVTYERIEKQLSEQYQSSVDLSLEYFRSANSLFEEISDNRGIVFTLNDMGMVNTRLGNYRVANDQLQNSLRLAKEIDFKEEIRDAYERLAKNASKMNNYESAYGYLVNFNSYKDSILNEERAKFTRSAEVKNQTLQKEKALVELGLEREIESQKRRTQNYMALIGFIVFLGVVAAGFSRYKLLKEREKRKFEGQINKAMARFVPMDFIKAIGHEKIQDAKLGDQVEKEVTVLFTDIRDFTSLSENLTPKENFEFVREYVGRMGPIIESNHGFISQFLGDGIMAIFQNSPSDALTACIEMRSAIQEYNEYLIDAGQAPIRVGMGMHTGPLVMGIIGDDVRREPTLISDTVNTAARIESATKTLNAPILISEEVKIKLDGIKEFVLIEKGEILVKGKQNALRVFECKDFV